MADDDSGSINPSYDHLAAVSQQPTIDCTRGSQSQEVHSKESSHNSGEDFPSIFNWWFCQLCLFWRQQPEHRTSLKHEGITEVKSQGSHSTEDTHSKEDSNHNSEKCLPSILNLRFCQLCLFWRYQSEHRTYFVHESISEEGSQESYPKELLPKTINVEMEELYRVEENSHLDDPGYNGLDQCALLSPNFIPPPLLYTHPASEPPKLQNLGNTCFFNAALQGIISTSELQTLYVMKPYNVIRTTPEPTMNTYTKLYEVPSKTCDDPLPLSVTSNPGPLTAALNELLWNVHRTSFVSPRDLLIQLGKRNPRFTRGRQEDSHEALKCVFDALKDEEIQSVKRRIESLYLRNISAEKKLKLKGYLRMAGKLPTAIGQVVEGKITSFRICHDCHDVSENIESFYDISLPMPKRKSLKKDNCSTNNNGETDRLNYLQINGIPTVSDADQPYSTLRNVSTFTELGMSTVLANDHQLKDYAGQLKSAADWQNIANKFNHTSSSASQQTKQQHQQAQYKYRIRENYTKYKYLITHDKDHFQEYLSKEGLNHQLKLNRTQVHMNGLQSCLSMFTDLDVLDENNKFVCKACTARKHLSSGDGGLALCQVSKQIMIHHLPPVLILHMKRFEISFEVTKDGRHISFPEILDMAPYCTAKCVEELGDSQNRILYGLYAVILHLGNSMYSGHYTAYVKTRPAKDKNLDTGQHGDYDKQYCKKGQWYFTSDTYIRKCSLEEVKESKAYMLFYERLPFIPIHDATMV